MIQIERFVFNPFQVNTFVLYDESRDCVIIDPGCSNEEENRQLTSFIDKNKLKPVRLLNTHSHVDHLMGNNFVAREYDLKPEIHEGGMGFHKQAADSGMVFGLDVEDQIMPEKFIHEGDRITFGNSSLEVIYAPGHVDGHVCYLSRKEKFVIAGDVLFQMSIGRTDLPTGNMDLLLQNIREKLFILPDDFTVYPGHGPETSIGFEKQNNPFLH